AAQETLKEMQNSVARQNQIVQLTDQGIAGGDLPAIEANRARARAARVSQAASAARGDLLAARASLAEALGVDAASMIDLPTASRSFATAFAESGSQETLTAQALAARRDVRARQSELAAAETLVAGARIDARPRLDFQFTGGVSDLSESPRY